MLKREKITTYEQAVQYLYSVPRFTSKNTVEDTRLFLDKLNNPDRTMQIIHVAGTNGKGSVCAYLRSLLEAMGKRTGVFTSPHLVDIRERFVIGGRMVDRDTFYSAFCEIYNKLDWEAIERGEGYHPTFFEYLFFMAMVIFAEYKPDYCILETGLGGRLDATNSVSNKLLTVITRISLDHVEYLGGTLEEIAGEKAGIMMEGVPLVYLDEVPEASEVFKKRAALLGITALGVSKNDYAKKKFNNKNIDFYLKSRYYGYVSLSLPTIASYQVENAVLAVRVMEELFQREIALEHMRHGLEDWYWPGRMEEILPEVYLDGAHNEDGIRAFLDTVKTDGYDGRRKLLFGVVRDKDYSRMFRELTQEGLFLSIALTTLKTDRSVAAESFKEIMEEYGDYSCVLYEDAGEALHDLLAGRKAGERIYAVGSLYLAGELKELIAGTPLLQA